MSDHLTIVALTGAAAFWALRLRARRSAVPAVRAAPELRERSDGRPAVAVPRIQPHPKHAKKASRPPANPDRLERATYLLSTRPRDAADPTAAMMDMMAGPGLCTPTRTRPTQS